MRRTSIFLAVLVFISTLLPAETPSSQVQVDQPPMRRGAPPDNEATIEQLERRGDELRAEKDYLDALDYYQAAIKKNPTSAQLYNKAGMSELLLPRLKEASRDFEQALRYDHQFADARNNLGVVYYEMKKYGRAVKEYEKAIKIQPASASYFSNMGAALFAKKEIEKAVSAYRQALQLDPDVLERNSRYGVTAQLPSPDDRAQYDYVMAKLYAKDGIDDRALQHLRRAMEEGYKDIENVYKDAEFASLRKDPRFTQLMSGRPMAIAQ